MTDTLEIPIFPLGGVMFPAGRLDLRIFEARYVDMTKACLRNKSAFGVTFIRSGPEVGPGAVPSKTGCTARIVDWEVPGPGLFALTTCGENVFRLLRASTRPDGLMIGTIELIDPPDPTPMPPKHAALADILAQILTRVGDRYFATPPRMDDAAWVGYRLAELLPVPARVKQHLLEVQDPIQRLDELAQLLRKRGSEGTASE